MSNHVPAPLIGFRVWTVKLWNKRPALFSRHGYSEIPWLLHEVNRAVCNIPPPILTRSRPIQKTEFWIINRFTGKQIGPGNSKMLADFKLEAAKMGINPDDYVLRNIVPPSGVQSDIDLQAEVDRLELENYENLVPHGSTHRCGFNAYYNLDDAIENEFRLYGSMLGQSYKEMAIIGMIAGSGKVIEHDYGFRAGKAQILCFIDTKQNYSMWRPKQLGKWLNVPIIKPEAIGWFGSLHGECRFEQNLTAGRN